MKYMQCYLEKKNEDEKINLFILSVKNKYGNKMIFEQNKYYPLGIDEPFQNKFYGRFINDEICEEDYYYHNYNRAKNKEYKKKGEKNTLIEELLKFTKYYLINLEDEISCLSNTLIKKKIANRLIFINKSNEIIGKKIIRDEHYFPENYKNNKENWIPAWHGTKFSSLKSIMELGLKLPGSILPNGTEIKPLAGHIKRYVEVNNDKDWAKGIFVSQSIFYSACGVYGDIIKSQDNEWIILIETRVKIGSYKTHESTVINYKLVNGEPKELEFKVENESDVVVIGILFLDKKYIRNINNYKDGSIFVSSNEEIFMNSLKNDNIYEEKKIEINRIEYHWKFLENKNIYINSNILCNNIVYQEKLKQWLQKPNPLLASKNLLNISLLYRGSRDGFKSSIFHSLCDNQGETLVIIKSTDKYIFGGYTSISWNSTKWNGKCGQDNNARRKGEGLEFVFSLKNPHDIPPSKFNIQKKWLDHSICCDINLGPIFGCNDIRIENNCNTNSNYFGYYDFQPGEYCFDDTTGKKRMLFTGSSSYKVEEIEVFKIKRDNNDKILKNYDYHPRKNFKVYMNEDNDNFY